MAEITPPPYQPDDPETDPNWAPIGAFIRSNRQALDTESPPAEGWRSLNARLADQRKSHTLWPPSWQNLAVAASIALIAALGLYFSGAGPASAIAALPHLPSHKLAPPQVKTIDAHYNAELERLARDIQAAYQLRPYAYKRKVTRLDKELRSFLTDIRASEDWTEEAIRAYSDIRARQLSAYREWAAESGGKYPTQTR